MPAELILGPLLRHVDEVSAAVWVETSEAATVSVLLDGVDQVWRARTFAVHGHHYALVEVRELPTGEPAPYRVLLDDRPVWPEPDSPFPPSTIRAVLRDEPLRMAFGSCRTSVPHDAKHHRAHGVDALRTFALALARGDRPFGAEWPMLLLLLGDQVYADETSEAMREFMASRRSLDEPPGEELADFEEYAHLYSIAWSDPALRWLLSTLPSLMIFDDHDVRDDWNTSIEWRQDMEAKPWWHDRIVAALGSYWVYQHLGNLSPAGRAADELWREVVAANEAADAGDAGDAGESGDAGQAEVDLTARVDAFAERVDKLPDTYRWSYARDLGESRLVVVDSRGARVLDPGNRSMLDEAEMQWLDEHLQGGCEHLLIGTSLPFLLPPGLHYLEAWDEALVDGAWGGLMARAGEQLRVAVDLEHWGAFHAAFERVCRMVTEVADGQRGPAPGTVTFLSGDVHHSYVSEVRREHGSRVLQLVCSPIRNPLPRHIRIFTAAVAHVIARPFGALTKRSVRVPDAPLQWDNVAGPWFDNNLALLEVHDGELRVVWLSGEVDGGDHTNPRLEIVADVRLELSDGEGRRRGATAELRAASRPGVQLPVQIGRRAERAAATLGRRNRGAPR